ncbi:MotA/TolQ/ExbB proton channel family protein [Leucothrix pacifica]|nr:MotA/TolQ/ExbB proton channel family protein [Leucothrix pacifica]
MQETSDISKSVLPSSKPLFPVIKQKQQSTDTKSFSATPLLSWLWLAGLLLFMVMLTWETGLLPDVLAADQTRISVVLLILTALTSVHCAYRSYQLTRLELELLRWQNKQITLNTNQTQATVLSTQLSLMLSHRDNRQPDNLALNGELLAEHFHYQHAFGWFSAGAMIKLGLLGTVIGFIMMLTSIGELDSVDIEQVQRLMQQMTQGMMVALNTTLLGLVGSMILGVQYLLLDHCADQLLLRVMTWVQQANQTQSQTDMQQEQTH